MGRGRAFRGRFPRPRGEEVLSDTVTARTNGGMNDPMRSLSILVLGLGLLVAACETPPAEEVPFAGPGDAARGKALVEAHCSGCHATGLGDASPYGRAPPMRTMHLKYKVENLAEAFAEGITVGHTGEKQMPEFAFEPDEIEDLIAYLKSFETSAP